jgi:hypothetical protein
MSPDPHDPRPLAPDDPRLSEWLDGRLNAVEAAEIERLVAASPELTKLVADLRGMRGALGAVPVTPPPAGFVRDVLAAIDAAGDEAADEAEVEEEWRRIERQRLDGEIAEAEDDAAEPAPEPMRQRWPWLALAGALAAGVIVAVVINRQPLPGDREVALVERQPRDRSRAGQAEQLATKRDESAVADRWLEEDAVPGGAGIGGGGLGAATEEARSLRAAAAPPAAAAPNREAMDGQAEQAVESKAAAVAVSPVRVVRYRIRTAADRARLDELVAASGTLAAARGSVVDAEALRKAEAEQDAAVDKRVRSRRGREGGPVVERIEVSGPAAEIATLVAALEVTAPRAKAGKEKQIDRGAGEPEAAGRPPAAPAQEAADGVAKNLPAEPALAAAAALPEATRLVIEVVDESGAGAPEGGP